VVGAITLSNAAAAIHARLAGHSALSKALAAFNASPEHAPAAKVPELKEAIGAVNSGPLGANSVPNPPNPLKNVAFDALGHANAIGYVVCGLAGLIAALLVVLMLGVSPHDSMITKQSLSSQD
jgi:hypothetical protein